MSGLLYVISCANVPSRTGHTARMYFAADGGFTRRHAFARRFDADGAKNWKGTLEGLGYDTEIREEPAREEARP